jgi:hypothetical protein
MNNRWPKVIHAVQVENRIADELEVKLQTFPHGDGEVLKIVVMRKSDPTGIILPNKLELH